MSHYRLTLAALAALLIVAGVRHVERKRAALLSG